MAAFSLASHFLAERFICFDTIRRSIRFSSNDTLFPILISGRGWVLVVSVSGGKNSSVLDRKERLVLGKKR